MVSNGNGSCFGKDTRQHRCMLGRSNYSPGNACDNWESASPGARCGCSGCHHPRPAVLDPQAAQGEGLGFDVLKNKLGPGAGLRPLYVLCRQPGHHHGRDCRRSSVCHRDRSDRSGDDFAHVSVSCLEAKVSVERSLDRKSELNDEIECAHSGSYLEE